jgi:hypothetical protein
MLEPPKYSLAEAREALREVHDQYTPAFFALRRGDQNHTASTFVSDMSKTLAYWRSLGFRVIDGPLETLQVAKTACQIDYAYDRADRCQPTRIF